MIEIVQYSETAHYPTLAAWWTAHGWPEMPPHKLPPFGFVATDEGKPVAGSFAYLDNGGTGVAMLEWTVGDPDASPRVLLKSIKSLLAFMTKELKRIGYDVIFTSCKVAGLIKVFEKVGFQQTDIGMTHLVHITSS